MANDYFNQLNYTLANEDAGMEHTILPESCAHVVTVCGSGSRVIPLLAKAPARISVVDISPVQLALFELRMETVRAFSHSEFLSFWGYRVGVWGMASDARKSQFERLQLKNETRDMLRAIFEKNRWESILLCGRWERTFVFFSRVARWILGADRIDGLFACENLEQQRQYVQSRILGWHWRLLLSVVGNARMFNALLYRGSFPKNNTGVGYVDYYDQAYRRLFEHRLARRNFFLQLTLLGELRYPEGLPLEADATVFSEAKKNLSKIRIETVQEDLVSWMAHQRGIGFVSFSNVASYFTGEREKGFLNEIRGAMDPGGLIVLRHYLHRPEGLDRNGFRDRSQDFKTAIAKEKVQMYDVEVLERIES